MRTAIAVAGCLLGSASLLNAAELKCSADIAVDGIQRQARAAMALPDALANSTFGTMVQKARFPTGDYSFKVSQFSGATVNESTRHCSATLLLSSEQRQDSGGRVEYDVSLTEDGQTLFTASPDFEAQVAHATEEYDTANGIADRLQTLMTGQTGQK